MKFLPPLMPPGNVIQFPPERQLAIRVEAEWDGSGWYVLAPNREHGWLHGSLSAALRDGREIARGFGVALASSAGVAS
jgi:hypothetical protein